MKKLTILVAIVMLVITSYVVVTHKALASNQVEMEDGIDSPWWGYRTCVDNPKPYGERKSNMPICTKDGACINKDEWYPQTLNKRCNKPPLAY